MKRNLPEQARLRRLRRLMEERNIDALLVCQRENVRYVTGFSGSSGCVLVSTGKPVLITDFRYQIQAAHEAPGSRVLIQRKDMISAIAEAARGLGTRQIWFDESFMTVERARLLKKQGLRMKAAKDPVSELRLRKDPSELKSIRKAIQRGEESFRALIRTMKAGMTEREVGNRLEWLMREKGAKKAAFDTIVASGANGAMPHATLSGRKIRTGDLITIDFGAEADGYYCDITRTICLGKPTQRQREIHDIVLHAQNAAIKSVRAGIACSDVDRAARDFIGQEGQGKHFGHATGHGIGLMVHEGPSISAMSKSRIQEGMVFTVEPGIYIPGWGGIRIEDMVCVTDSGAQILTSLSRDLLVR